MKKTTDKKANDNTLKTVSVPNFPADVWNQFAGLCKMKGRIVASVLEDLLRDWNDEQKKMGF